MGLETLHKLAQQALVKQLHQALDCPLFIVGGAVRDALMSKTVNELDFTCPLAPEEMIARLEAKNIRTIPTGIKHQTVTAVIEEKNLEVTSFRTAGMNPEGGLKLGSTIQEDLSYRDFTINALAYDVANNILVDPFDGEKDIESKKLRAVNDAKSRFSEDPLRVMRLLRFHSQLNFEIEAETLKATKIYAQAVSNCSVERVREEFNKLLTGENVESAMSLMHELGIMTSFIPELATCYGFEQNKFHDKDVFFHTIDVINKTRPDLTLRLAALFHDIGKPPALSVDAIGDRHFYKHERIGAELTREIMARLKYSNKTIEEVSCLVDTHMRPIEAGKPGLRRLLRDTGEVFNLWRELKEADAGSVRKDIEVLKTELDKFDQEIAEIKAAPDVSPLANLALKGNDLIEMGLEPSPLFGAVLRALHEKVLDHPDLNEKNKLKIIAIELLMKRSLPAEFKALLERKALKYLPSWEGRTDNTQFFFEFSEKIYLGLSFKGPLMNGPAQKREFTEGLWNYDLVEAFLGLKDNGYLEINLALNGAWWAAEFSDYRKQEKGTPAIKLDDVISHSEDNENFVLASFSYQDLDFNGEYNVTAILGKQSYYSLNPAPTNSKPDFHLKELRKKS